MLRIISASFICLVVSTSVAAAADLRTPTAYKAPVAAAPTIYSWTGFYLGGHGGGAWAKEELINVSANPLAGPGPLATGKPKGAIAGGQIGFNYQFAAFVVGAEFDASWTNADTSVTVPALIPGISFYGTTESKWFSTLTARFGYAFDNVLLYGKAGAAWTDSDCFASAVFSANGAVIPGGGPVPFGNTRTGWTLGAGLEYGFDKNWSAKVEYNYLDFGTEHYTIGPIAGLTAPFDVKSNVQLVKAGLNYRFGL